MPNHHVPLIIFRLNGGEILSVPAHVLLVVRSFQEGKYLAPAPGSQMEVEINDGTQSYIFQFKMPPADKQ